MRHPAGLAVSGLAAVFAAIALFLGVHVTGQAATSLLNGQETLTLTASGASYVSPVRLTQVTGASITVTDTIRETPEAGYPLIAVWSVVSSAYDTTHGQQLEPMSATFAFNRTTAELVNCCNKNVNGNAGIQQHGISGWRFPRGARAQNYALFDTTLDGPVKLVYSGTDTVDGVPAYLFTEKIPGGLVGTSPLSPGNPELYTMHRTYWVDPQTGALLKISENEDLHVVDSVTRATIMHLFRADLSTTPATIADLVRQDARGQGTGTAAQRERLLSFGVAGALAAVAAVLFLWSTADVPRRPAREAYR
jgi:hypothetical protein